MFEKFPTRLFCAVLFIGSFFCFPTNSLEGQSDTGGAIFVTTSGGINSAGTLYRIKRTFPWSVVSAAPLQSSDAVVQTFGRFVYVVEPATDEIKVFRFDGALVNTFSVGAGTEPRDIAIVSPTLAYVSRANSSHLYRVNPQTGVGTDVINLSFFGGSDSNPDMERMIIVNGRLFIQLRRIDSEESVAAGNLPNGAIAVIDIATETIIDASPTSILPDPIELMGPSPRLRMDVYKDSLLVSSTAEDHLNLQGGIELVDLNTLSSQGFVVAESDVAALGGVILTKEDQGYFVFHTDILPSNHLEEFSISGGNQKGPEVIVDLGCFLDSLLFDPRTNFLFMPSSTGGLYVLDITTNQQPFGSPVFFPGKVVDQVLVGPARFRDVPDD